MACQHLMLGPQDLSKVPTDCRVSSLDSLSIKMLHPHKLFARAPSWAPIFQTTITCSRVPIALSLSMVNAGQNDVADCKDTIPSAHAVPAGTAGRFEILVCFLVDVRNKGGFC